MSGGRCTAPGTGRAECASATSANDRMDRSGFESGHEQVEDLIARLAIRGAGRNVFDPAVVGELLIESECSRVDLRSYVLELLRREPQGRLGGSTPECRPIPLALELEIELDSILA